MQVRFSKLHIVSKIPEKTNTQLAGKYTQNVLLPKVKADIYNPAYCRLASLGDILNETYGIYSSEDIEKIAEMKTVYSGLSQDELNNIRQTGIKTFMDNFKTKLDLKAADEGGKMYLFNHLKLTPEYQTEIKAEQLKLAAMKQAIREDVPELLCMPYSEWFNCKIGIPASAPSKTIYEHPCDKILRHTGILNSKETEEIDGLIEKYKEKSVFRIFEEKSNLLEKMQQYFNDKNSDLIGQYSNHELSEMTKLVQEYIALNAVQVQQGYFSKYLETLLYSGISKFEPNEYIEGVGLITDKITINGIKGIISFIYRNNEYMLRMYDTSILGLKTDFLKSLPETIYLEDLNTINHNAENIINAEPKSLISEIRFRIMDKKNTGIFLRRGNEDINTVYNIMGNSKYSYLILNFRNFYKDKYGSAGKLIGVRLLKLLKDKEPVPVFLIASPYESTHSPVSMYLRAGFKPLFKTENEVYAEMSKHCEYMNKNPLAMYAENLSILGDRIDKLNQIYFPLAGQKAEIL